MKPIEFEGVNCTYAKDQPEYLPLPVKKLEGAEGRVVACWKMSPRERIKALFTGCVWVSLWTFNKPLTPSRLSVDRDELIPGEASADD